LKTSMSLNKKLLEALEDYRRQQKIIPSKSDAITELIMKALTAKDESFTEVPQEAKTALPKGALKLESLKIHLRFREDKGGSASINLPYALVKDIFQDEDLIDLIIVKKPKTSE